MLQTSIKARVIVSESGAIDVAKTLEALAVLLEKKNAYLDKREGVDIGEETVFAACPELQARIRAAMGTILANHARRSFRLDWLVPAIGAILFDYSETCEKNIVHFFSNSEGFSFEGAMVVCGAMNQACMWGKVA